MMRHGHGFIVIKIKDCYYKVLISLDSLPCGSATNKIGKAVVNIPQLAAGKLIGNSIQRLSLKKG